MTNPRLFILVMSLLIPLMQAGGQAVEGRVLDRHNKRPLAFVNIVYTEDGRGTVSNIDGKFSISPAGEIEFLKFSYLGYETMNIPLEEVKGMMEVRLERMTYDIEEVEVRPGYNPAHRIIDLVRENRPVNDPENIRSFSYTSYSKMYFTADLDSLRARAIADSALIYKVVGDSTIVDSSKIRSIAEYKRAQDFFDSNHIFLMEFVSEREFMHPDRNREVVKASRISGLKDPSFTMLASQVQSFSFYDDLIMIWDRKYLNPISSGSTRKYLFVLEDTLYTGKNDSLFIISYRPRKGRNFDGLKGILHINSNGYAIQNVIAEGAETGGIVDVRIQQNYDFIEGRQWFPVELNTDLTLHPSNISTGGVPATIVGIGKSYLSDVSLNPELNKRDFSHIETQVEKGAHKMDEAFWSQYRTIPLTMQDTNTYHLIDSIGEANNLDRKMLTFEAIATGYIPVGFINIAYMSLLHWNKYEGLRLGVELETNELASKWVVLGGKFAYGTRDKDYKYGGHLRLNLNRHRTAFLKFKYDNDVVESAGWNFIDPPSITSSEVFRSFLIANKDRVEMKSAELQFPALRYMKLNAYLSQGVRQVTTDYLYEADTPEGIVSTGRFHLAEAGLKLKYAYKEKFIETPRGNLLSMGTDYPVIYANLHIGLPVLGGEYEYTRIEGKISKTFRSKSFGDTRVALIGGWTDRALPYPLLYAGAGSHGNFTIEAENSFSTMRQNEFVSDRFASLHVQQDFGKLLFRREKFQPGVALVGSAGFGTLKFDGGHINLDQRTLEKGFYETGILFNNLLRQWIIGYGLGVFYRFGPYTLPETIDNFVFKLTVRFILQ